MALRDCNVKLELNKKKLIDKVSEIIERDLRYIKLNLNTCEKYEWAWQMRGKWTHRQFRT